MVLTQRICSLWILVSMYVFHIECTSEMAAFLPITRKRSRICVSIYERNGKNVNFREKNSPTAENRESDDVAAAAGTKAYCIDQSVRRTLSYSTLVLNADYQPLSFMPLSLWSWQDAVKAVFQDRVAVVENYDCIVRSSDYALHVPSVIALKAYVNLNKNDVALTRRNLFLRDSYSCQYCGTTHLHSHLTFDHVQPRCKGGDTNWENVVAACKICNNRKGGLTTKEIARMGMHLIKEPRRPSVFELQNQARNFPPKYVHDSWRAYLT